MGQKVNPHGARVGVILDWSTKWYAGKKDFSNNLVEDYNLRKMLKTKKELENAGISRIDIQRTASKVQVSVYTAKPGIVIGKGGAGVEALKKEIEKFTGKQVDQALAILKFTPKAAAPVVEKLLNSAIANAENNLEMDRSSLYVAEVYANQGPTLKRYWARSHGRADLIKKHTSHITIVLDQK